MDSAGALLYLMAPSPGSKRFCMRLAPLAIAPHATSPSFASRAKVAHARTYDTPAHVQAEKMVYVRKVIDNDRQVPRSPNNRQREQHPVIALNC